MVIRLERVPAPTITAGSTVAQGTDPDDPRDGASGGRRRRRIAIVLALVTVLVASGASLTAWALIGPPGAVGHDVSYPQCGTALPSGGTFGIVGVNGGKVSTANSCLSTQYAWASRTTNGAALYANTGNPGSISTFYWPASGSRDPALCANRTSSSDPGCAYDYGWHGAKNSLQIAQNAVSGADGRTWWLDVELANSWNGSTSANAAALQGAVDGLHDSGVGTVGIYSTAYQWGQITGGYASGNAASYRSGWSASFTPKHPMEQAPLWIAGLSSLDAASRNCSTTFTGGTAALAQYTDGNTDGDLVCGAAPAPPTTPPTTSTTPSTSTATSTAALPTTAPSSTTAPTSPTSTMTAAPTTTAVVPTTTTATPTTTTVAPTTTTLAPSTTLAPTVVPTTTTTAAPPTAAPAVPGVPTRVTAATDRVAGIDLGWTAPTVTGGSPVNRYVIMRGTAPGREAALGILTCRTPTCAWRDASTARGATYYYQVVAVNDANAVGPRSPEVYARAR